MSETKFAENIAGIVLDRPGEDPDSELSTLARQFLRAREALADIAKQKLWAEMPDEDMDNVSWMEGYEGCVLRARAALSGEPS